MIAGVNQHGCFGNIVLRTSIHWKQRLCQNGVSRVPTRAAGVVGIPKISWYTDFFQNSVFLKLGLKCLDLCQTAHKKGLKIEGVAQNYVKNLHFWNKFVLK